METAVKTWEPIEHEGKPARLYPDGAIRNERGHFITQHPAGHTITQADARQLASRRHELAQEAIRERITSEMRSFAPNPVNTPVDAYAEIVTRQAVALYGSDKPRFDDVEKLGQLMDLVPRKQAQEAGPASSDPLNAALVGLVQAVTARIGADNYPYRKHNTSQAVPDVVEGEAHEQTEADEGSGGGTGG